MKKISFYFEKYKYLILIYTLLLQISVTGYINSAKLRIKNKLKLKNIATPPILDDSPENYKTGRNNFYLDIFYFKR